jgi:hypothetical protein
MTSELVLFHQELRCLGAREVGSPGHQVQKERVIHTTITSQIANDRFLLAAPGQTILVESHAAVVQVEPLDL